ncbi:MAG TPA: ABC transporter permease [Blastocatellia bacterium]|nr:ABC transporter permease [Blastocatellia bacterium]
MANAKTTTRFRFWLWLVHVIGVIVPRRLRSDWRQEWEAELGYREKSLAEWDRIDWRNKRALLWHSLGAFADALWMQPRRLEDEMFQDLRFGARMLLKNKSFTAVAVLSLALGIGANAAIFSAADALLWRSLPAANNERLFMVARGDGRGGAFSYPDYVDYRDRNQVFAGLAAFESVPLAFGDGERSAVVMGELVTGNFFDVLGAPMAQGRAFLHEEDRTPGAHAVVVVSHDFWQRRLGGDPQLIGKALRFNNHSFTVIGVAGAGFLGVSLLGRADVWVPMMMQAAAKPNREPELNDRQAEILFAIGQLKAGVSRAQAEGELETINRQLQQAYPAPNRWNLEAAAFQQSRRLTLAPAQGMLNPFVRDIATLGAILASAVAGIVLLIACVNLANLLLARGAMRHKEIAIRLAVGASRLRLIRQLLTESLLLALLGAAAGLLLAFWLNQLLMSVQPPTPPPFEFKADLRLDGRALGFTLLLSMLTGVIFGFAPAWEATRPDVVPALKDETGRGDERRFSLRNLLVVAQVALSLALLIGAGLFIRSLRYMQAIDPGFDTDNGLVMSFDLGFQGYSEERGRQFHQQLVERLAATPGVRSVAIADFLPLGLAGRFDQVSAEGQRPPTDGPPITAHRHGIGLRYFETMGIPFLRGRDFTALDTASSEPVVIINESLARGLWPSLNDIGEVIGRRIRLGPDSNAPWNVIVGVAGDCKYFGLREERQMGVWTPLSQAYAPFFQLTVRTTAETPGVVASLRREVAALDPNLPIQSLITLREQFGLWLWTAEMSAGLVTALGVLGMLLAAIGLYGVMSYAVARRTREIGIRMALGAQARDMLKMVIGQGLRLTLAGVAIGLAVTFAAARLVESLLYGVSARDPITFVIGPLALAAVALLSCYVPARRATKVDPLVALRHE